MFHMQCGNSSKIIKSKSVYVNKTLTINHINCDATKIVRLKEVIFVEISYFIVPKDFTCEKIKFIIKREIFSINSKKSFTVYINMLFLRWC